MSSCCMVTAETGTATVGKNQREPSNHNIWQIKKKGVCYWYYKLSQKKILIICTHSLVGNLSLWSIMPNESSFGKIGYEEVGMKHKVF